MLVNSQNMAMMRLALPALRCSNIEPVLFKGPLALAQLYGDLFFRTANDMDMLVRKAQFDDAVSTLLSVGFTLRPDCGNAWWRQSLGEVHLQHVDFPLCTIDLHHKLQQPGCPSPKRPEEIHDLVTQLSLGSEVVQGFGPVGSLLVASLNLVKGVMAHKFSGKYALDVAVGLSRLSGADQSNLEELLKRQDLLGSFGFAVQLSEAAFDVELDFPSSPPQWQNTEMRIMVIDPENPSLNWPRRREMLWHMTRDREGLFGARLRFAQETLRALSGEALRKVGV